MGLFLTRQTMMHGLCMAGFAAAAVLGATVDASAQEAVAEPATAPLAQPAVGAGSSGWSAQIANDRTSGIALDDRQTELIGLVSKFFGDMKSLRGDFRQTAADSTQMRGKFWMKQPGKFRFDYNRPSRQVIISDGRYLAVQDHDINSEDRVKLDETPFRVLLRENVDLIRDARILEVQESDDIFLLTIADKSPDAIGKIKLFFSLQPKFELKEWVTTDAQGLDTRVEVGNLVKGETLAASKFKIEMMANPFAGP